MTSSRLQRPGDAGDVGAPGCVASRGEVPEGRTRQTRQRAAGGQRFLLRGKKPQAGPTRQGFSATAQSAAGPDDAGAHCFRSGRAAGHPPSLQRPHQLAAAHSALSPLPVGRPLGPRVRACRSPWTPMIALAVTSLALAFSDAEVRRAPARSEPREAWWQPPSTNPPARRRRSP